MRSVRIHTPASRMSPLDAAFLHAERTYAPLHLACLAILERTPTVKLITTRLREVAARNPRFSQRIARPLLGLAHPTWEDDPDFHPHRHLRFWRVRGLGRECDLRELAEFIVASPIDRARPLWELHLVEGLDSARAAALFKVHHCLMDGVSASEILEALVDRPTARDRRFVHSGSRLEPPPRLIQLASELAAAVRVPAAALRDSALAVRDPSRARESVAQLQAMAVSMLRSRRQGKEAGFSGPLGTARQLQFARIPMGDLDWIRERGVDVDDVFVSIVAGGLRRYFRSLNIQPAPETVKALVPVSVRRSSEMRSLGNRLSVVVWPLAVNSSSEGERLAATQAEAARWRAAGAVDAGCAAVRGLDLLPAWLLASVIRRLPVVNATLFLAGDLRGPREPARLFGSRVEAIYPIAPITRDVGLSVAALSFAGSLHLGFNASNSFSGLEFLRHAVVRAFSDLAADAAQTLEEQDGASPKRLQFSDSDLRAGLAG